MSLSDVPTSISLIHSLYKIVSYSEMSFVPKLTNPRRLAAFDFDYTITNDNTDTVVRALLPKNAIHPKIEKIVETHGWTQYMQEIFKLLHERSIKPDLIKKAIREIPEVPGMIKCLKTLHENNFDLIIISDSNTEFINEWNTVHNVSNIFTKVYTNPAKFDDNGLLKIRPYHLQRECNLSAMNLCKGKILHDFIKDNENENNIFYENIFYIGDGSNDLCPILKLRRNDYGCPRKDFSLEKRLKKIPTNVEAQLLYWSNGFELLEKIMNSVQI